MKRYLFLLTLFCSALPQYASAEPARSSVASRRTVLGWVEQARLYPGGFLLNAKLDSGADNSSLHAENLTYIQENNKTYVQFDIFNRHGDKHQIRLPLIRNTRIKLKKGGLQRRPVVRLGLCISNMYREVDFNLVDRSQFYYPMLIGRSFLSGNVIVDSSVTYSQEPNCQPPAEFATQ